MVRFHLTQKCSLEGGSFDPWGGPGFDACEVLTGPDFQDIFYKQNWASNVKLISYYMIYGYDKLQLLVIAIINDFTALQWYKLGRSCRTRRLYQVKFRDLWTLFKDSLTTTILVTIMVPRYENRVPSLRSLMNSSDKLCSSGVHRISGKPIGLATLRPAFQA